MRNFRQTGDVVTVPAPANVKSGDGVLVGTLFGVNSYDAENGEDIEIKVNGVFELPKLGAQAWTVGALVYWDNSNKRCTTVGTDNTLIGKALEAAANPSPTGIVRLSGN